MSEFILYLLFQGLQHVVKPSSRESSGTPVQMIRRMSTPRVESPRLDSYRYSLLNLEETLENDLGNYPKPVLNIYDFFRKNLLFFKLVF